MSLYKQKLNPISGQFNLVPINPITSEELSDVRSIPDLLLNIMLNAFRIAQIGSLTIFAMVKGFMDEYEDESGVDLVNSINQNYNNTDDYYTNEGIVDSYTKLLLHLDNNVDDSELTPKTVTNNGATFSASVKKFGGYAGSFNGSSSYLSVPDSDDFNFGSGDFTIDWWINFNILQNGGIFQQFDAPGSRFTCYYNYNDGGGPNNLITVSINFGGGWVLLFHVNFEPTPGQWYHMALVRNINTWNFYVDGVAQVKDLANGDYSNALPDYSNPFIIGQYSSVFWVNGYIDEFRVSKGIARWTSNFIPPTSAYPLAGNMTLLSNTQVASIIPVSARIILFEEDLDVIALNTDLKAYISRDNGTTYSQVTLEDEGSYVTSAKILSGVVTISSQPSGTNIKYKIETLNDKKLKLHGTGISWK